MKLTSVEAIAAALEAAEVRYLVAGGLAVAAHGYLRYTKDVDLVVQLVPENIERAFAALGSMGYRSIVPITAAQFGNSELRQTWIRDKGMQVLQFWCDAHIETPVDLFVDEPFAFDQEYAQALIKPLSGSRPIRFVSIATLIGMKESAGRPQDLDDVAHLRLKRGKVSGPATDPGDGIDWSLTTWEGSRREQLRRWSQLPLERVILALEEMQQAETSIVEGQPADPGSSVEAAANERK